MIETNHENVFRTSDSTGCSTVTHSHGYPPTHKEADNLYVVWTTRWAVSFTVHTPIQYASPTLVSNEETQALQKSHGQ